MVVWPIAGAGILLLSAVLFFLYLRHSVHKAAQGRIYAPAQMEEIPEAKVALVLGARVYSDGRLSAVLKERVDTAIKLYKAGKVEKLLMSGDNRTIRYNEVSAMRNYAIAQGVPSDDVVRDFAGFRTYDSVYRAKEVWDLDRFIIVTQQFHLPRSLYIARALGIDAVGVAATGGLYRPSPRLLMREQGARLLAWRDVVVGREPYFLGEKEGLSGDAQTTRVRED